MNWKGVFPALTTTFLEDGSLDVDATAKHARWIIDSGCHGVVLFGSLGEGGWLSAREKSSILQAVCEALDGQAPVIVGIAALRTADAVSQATSAAESGAKALMVLPPYVYSTDWREMRTYVEGVMRATDLPCMLYNNPVAYKTDFLPHQVAELAARNFNLASVKESSGDVRRVTAIRNLVGDRLELLVGVDDVIVEGIRAGAVGWVAGLANALPAESVDLWKYAVEGSAQADSLYKWFLPLLQLDTVPKFVQYIKLVEERVGAGRRIVRPPRLLLEGEELNQINHIIDAAMASRPTVAV